MYNRPNSPRTIGGVLDDAVRLYRESFTAVLPIAIAIALIYVVPYLIMGERLAAAAAATPANAVAAFVGLFSSPTFWLTYFLVLLGYFILNGALISSIDAVVTGTPPSLGEALQVGMARLPAMFFAALLFSLAVGVGMMLLIIPGIYVWGIFQIVFIPLVIERAGIFASFGTSNRLIKGYWWRSSTITTIAIVMLLVISMLAGALVAAVVGFAKPGPMTAMLVNQMVSAIVNVFLVGWFPCVLITMYYDLKLRHDGEDLATRVDALAAR